MYIDRNILVNVCKLDVWNRFALDFPTRIYILKDKLLLFYKRTEPIHLQDKLTKELKDYF